MLTHSSEPWYDDARLALEQEDAGEYANEAELREITRRFWPIYFAHFDKRAQKYLDECVVAERPNPDALKLFNEGIAEWDMRPELARIDAPTLVITGDVDFICGPACAADIAAGVAGSNQVLIEDCGHFTFVEQPAAVPRRGDAIPDLIDEAVDAIQRGKTGHPADRHGVRARDDGAACRRRPQSLPPEGPTRDAADRAACAEPRHAVRARSGAAWARRS